MFGQRIPDSDAFRSAVGQAIIDKIRGNASSGRGRDGKKFGGRASRYSKEYAKSLEFKAASKSRGDVTMTLTGDMLGFMDVIEQSRNTITIGFGGREEQLKAHGHILGSSPGPRVKRDFFGLPERQYESISQGFTIPRLVPEGTPSAVSRALSTLTTLRELFSGGS